jgi:hypothetical protein
LLGCCVVAAPPQPPPPPPPPLHTYIAVPSLFCSKLLFFFFHVGVAGRERKWHEKVFIFRSQRDNLIGPAVRARERNPPTIGRP